jgi:hypothetical protein
MHVDLLGKEVKYGHENMNKVSQKGTKSLISNGHKPSPNPTHYILKC